MPDPTGPEPVRATFADRLNYLFETFHPRGSDRDYTGKEVAAAIGLSTSHLSELRRGIKTNPSMRVIESLAGFFEVRPAYLHGDPGAVDEVEAEVELRRAMSDAQVHDIAMRVAGMEPGQRAAMMRVLAELIRKENGA